MSFCESCKVVEHSIDKCWKNSNGHGKIHVVEGAIDVKKKLMKKYVLKITTALDMVEINGTDKIQINSI